MYRIIGADQKEYGPITADQIRQWISEGRLDGQTQVCAEGTREWKPLALFPEFGFDGGQANEIIPAVSAGVPLTAEEILAQNYSLDIMSCVSRGWALLKGNFGLLLVTSLVVIILGAVAGWVADFIFAGVGVNDLPLATSLFLIPVYAIINSLVIGPATGGLYRVYLSAIRRQLVTPADVFVGFKSGFQDLFLGQWVMSLIIAACLIPYTIVSEPKINPIMKHLQELGPSAGMQEVLSSLSQLGSAIASCLPVFLLCMIPVTYLSVNLIFTIPLVADKQMGFWAAMKMSWRMVHKHWFHIFGLMVAMGLLNVAGLCVCGVGLLVTGPVGLAALMCAYENIFGRKKA